MTLLKKHQKMDLLFLEKTDLHFCSAATAYSMSLRGDSRLVSLWGCGSVARIAAGDKQANRNTSFDEGMSSSPKTHTVFNN